MLPVAQDPDGGPIQRAPRIEVVGIPELDAVRTPLDERENSSPRPAAANTGRSARIRPQMDEGLAGFRNSWGLRQHDERTDDDSDLVSS